MHELRVPKFSLSGINKNGSISSSAVTFRPLIKESVVYGIGITANRFVGFLLLPLYTRLLTPAAYGLLDLLNTTGVLLFIVAELQIISGVARGYYEAKAEGRVRILIGTAVVLYIRNTALWTVAGFVVFYFWGYRFGGAVGWEHAVPVILILLPSQLFSLLQIILRFEAQAKKFLVFSVLDVVTSAVLSIGAVVLLDWGVAGVLWGLFASKVIWSAALLYLRRGYFAWQYDGRYAREVLGYGLPLVPSVLTKWGQNYANRYILVLWLSLTDVGLFSVAIRLASLVAMIDTAFRLAWDPYAVRMFREENSEPNFARVLGLYLVGMFTICTVLAVFGTLLVRMMSGEAYLGAGPLVGFLAFGLLWNGATNLLGAGNGWERRTYWNALGFAVGGVLNLSLLVWAVPRWGLLAAGITYLLGSLAAAWIVFATAQRSHPIPYKVAALWLTSVGSVAVASCVYYLDASSILNDFSWFGQLVVRLSFILAVACAISVFALIRGIDIRRFATLVR